MTNKKKSKLDALQIIEPLNWLSRRRIETEACISDDAKVRTYLMELDLVADRIIKSIDKIRRMRKNVYSNYYSSRERMPILHGKSSHDNDLYEMMINDSQLGEGTLAGLANASMKKGKTGPKKWDRTKQFMALINNLSPHVESPHRHIDLFYPNTDIELLNEVVRLPKPPEKGCESYPEENKKAWISAMAKLLTQSDDLDSYVDLKECGRRHAQDQISGNKSRRYGRLKQKKPYQIESIFAEFINAGKAAVIDYIRENGCGRLREPEVVSKMASIATMDYPDIRDLYTEETLEWIEVIIDIELKQYHLDDALESGMERELKEIWKTVF